jgi:hypothetical protein
MVVGEKGERLLADLVALCEFDDEEDDEGDDYECDHSDQEIAYAEGLACEGLF